MMKRDPSCASNSSGIPEKLVLAIASGVELEAVLDNLPAEKKVVCETVDYYESHSGNTALKILHTGVGPKRVRKTLNQLPKVFFDGSILTLGVCGGIDRSLKVGDPVLPEATMNLKTGQRVEFNLTRWQWLIGNIENVLQGGTMLSANRMVDRAEKEEFLQKQPELVAVDMESFELARFARERGLPFAVLKSVADPIDFNLPKKEVLELTYRRTPFSSKLVVGLSHPIELLRTIAYVLQLRRVARANAECVKAALDSFECSV